MGLINKNEGKFTVIRHHEIHCGHRVVGHEHKCAHLHGHSYGFNFYCQSSELDSLGRVIDFSIIKSILCQWLEENWDHRLILWQQDPWLKSLQAIDSSVISIPYNPTAENLALYLVKDIAPQLLINYSITLTQVIVNETAKCSAVYSINSHF